METAGGPPAGLRGGAWAESPGLSAAPGARSPCPSRRAARRGPPGRTCHSPRSRARRERGRGRGASFLSETYGIRQEFGPPRFKKTNKGKIVREGPPRAAGPTHCPPRSPPGRPGLPAGAEPQVGGASPGWSPGGLPCPGPWLTRHPPLSRAEKAPGGQGKKGAAGLPPPQESLGYPPALRQTLAEPQPLTSRSIRVFKPGLEAKSRGSSCFGSEGPSSAQSPRLLMTRIWSPCWRTQSPASPGSRKNYKKRECEEVL